MPDQNAQWFQWIVGTILGVAAIAATLAAALIPLWMSTDRAPESPPPVETDRSAADTPPRTKVDDSDPQHSDTDRTTIDAGTDVPPSPACTPGTPTFGDQKQVLSAKVLGLPSKTPLPFKSAGPGCLTVTVPMPGAGSPDSTLDVFVGQKSFHAKATNGKQHGVAGYNKVCTVDLTDRCPAFSIRSGGSDGVINDAIIQWEPGKLCKDLDNNVAPCQDTTGVR